MASRIRKDEVRLYDIFAEVASDGTSSWVLWKFPDSFQDEKVLKSIAEFSFPCPMTSDAVQLFSFVLTDIRGSYTFGFCRHTPRSRTCFCFLSALPWPEVFFKLLNHIAILADQNPPSIVEQVLSLAYESAIPGPNESLVLQPRPDKLSFECVCPDPGLLPRIPENRYLTEYYNAVSEGTMLAIFASMLCERRIIFTGSKVGKLSACVMAANLLIYPMHWQHIFVPVLPVHLCSYLNAPMPYMIGVPSVLYKQKSLMREVDLSDVVVLDIDSNVYESPFNDVAALPNEVAHTIRKNLRPNNMIGDGIARSFLRGLVVLIGGYREALQFRLGESISFNPDMFLQSRAPAMRPFLDKLLHLQIFRQFIDDRLDRLNNGLGLKDQFEEECNVYSGKDSNKFKSQYNDWLNQMKKEGGALVRQIRNKVKNKGKGAINDIRGKITELKEDIAPKEFDPRAHVSNAANTLKDKICHRKSVHLKHMRPSKWVQFKSDAEDSGIGGRVEGRPNVDSEQLFPNSRLDGEPSSRINLMSEMQEVLSRRSSLLRRLEEQTDQDGYHSVRHAKSEVFLSPSEVHPSEVKSYDLIDLKSEADQIRPSSGSAVNEPSNLEILKSIFSSEPPSEGQRTLEGPPRTEAASPWKKNWETFD